VYSVISPEGCAAILWKSAEKAPEAAEIMGITAHRLKALGLIDRIVNEPLGGAHRDPAQMALIGSTEERFRGMFRRGPSGPPLEAEKERIAMAREYYNDQVMWHNTRVERIPDFLFAMLAGLHKRQPFLATGMERKEVEVHLHE
jgi:hypothetical protein